MDLTHQSITSHNFDLNRRGYDPDAVDTHLSQIATAVAARESRIAELETTVASLEAKVQDANESEEALRLTLKAAAHAKEELLAGARQQAKAMEDEAAAKAEAVLAEASHQASRLTQAAQESAAAIQQGAREQARNVARAALAESEVLVRRIEELRDRLEAAETALGNLSVGVEPQLNEARNTLNEALEKAREGVENPEILEEMAAQAPAFPPDTSTAETATTDDGFRGEPAQPEFVATAGEGAPSSPEQPVVQPAAMETPQYQDQQPAPQAAEPPPAPITAPGMEDDETRETVAAEGAATAEQPAHEEPHLEVVEPAESSADISMSMASA